MTQLFLGAWSEWSVRSEVDALSIMFIDDCQREWGVSPKGQASKTDDPFPCRYYIDRKPIRFYRLFLIVCYDVGLAERFMSIYIN